VERVLAGNLEENIITLLVWSDKASSGIRMRVDPDLFSTSAYRYIAQASYDYIDEFRSCPKEHIADLVEHLLNTDGPISRLLGATIINMKNLYPTLNETYILNELEKFLKTRFLQKAIEEATSKLADDDLSGAEAALNTVHKSISMSPGILLNDPIQALSFLHKKDFSGFFTGIDHLDNEGIYPKKQQLFLIMAPSGKGKTWGLIHMGKQGMMFNQKVLHISLEMSEEEVAERYLESIFSLVSHHSVIPSLNNGVHSVRIPEFNVNSLGGLLGISSRVIERMVLSADNEEEIKEKIARLQTRSPIMIKSFPSGSLTMSHFRAYLDMMDKVHDYRPDAVMFDYPDLMKMPKTNDKRMEVGDAYVELRGLAAERDFALVTATQSNRPAMQATIVKDYHAAEDISKISTSDNVITINQTDKEKEIGLARIYVAKARHSRSGFQVIVSQNYGIGQFCLESLYHDKGYDTEMARLGVNMGEGDA
jgi:replicative DNA helicase